MTPEQERPTPEDVLAEAIAEAMDHRSAALAKAESDYDKWAKAAQDAYRAELAEAGEKFETAREAAYSGYGEARREAMLAYQETTGKMPGLEVPQ